MNIIISAVVGGLVATLGVIGGVSAYTGEPNGVPANELYNYASN